MNEEAAIAALRQLKEVFDKYNIEFWLDFGTLLGAIRSGKFIPWDHDIDLGIWCKEFAKIESASKELKNRGFKIKIDISSVIPLHAKIENGCTIDVFAYHLKYKNETIAYSLWGQPLGYLLFYLQWIILNSNKEQIEGIAGITHMLFKIFRILPSFLKEKFINCIWWVLSVKMKDQHWSKFYNVTTPSHYLTNLSKTIFYGMEFKVPTKTENYLTFRYGEDWKTPKKEYTYYKDGGAIRKD